MIFNIDDMVVDLGRLRLSPGYHRLMIERFAQMPTALRAHARWDRLGPSRIPVLLIHPDWNRNEQAPMVIWMHGRTAHKELDPGRYLRWMRAGIGACAIDLPGHGERLDPVLHDAAHMPHLIRQLMAEIDEIVEAMAEIRAFDMQRIGIGGMSGGGMAALARLCQPHPFRCASVEATTGALERQFPQAGEAIADINPTAHLNEWREIPFQAIHSKGDQMIAHENQVAFIEALWRRYRDPSLIDFITYEQTGARAEHIGFGRFSPDAKDRQREFFRRWLTE